MHQAQREPRVRWARQVPPALLVPPAPLGRRQLSTMRKSRSSLKCSEADMTTAITRLPFSGSSAGQVPATVSGVWFARLRGAASGANVSGGAADTSGHLFTLIGRPTGTTLDMGIDGISVSSTTSAAAVPDVPAAQTIHLGSDGLSGKGPMVVAFFGIYAGDIGAHPNFSTFKAFVASLYGLSVA